MLTFRPGADLDEQWSLEGYFLQGNLWSRRVKDSRDFKVVLHETIRNDDF